MPEIIKALVLGDVIGQPGCRALFIHLKELRKKWHADLVIVNGENAAAGFGMTPEIAEQFYTNGIDVITSGNHIWQKKEILPMLKMHDRLLRPENYPPGIPGKGICLVNKKGLSLGVINLQGRVRLMETDCPFRVAEKAVRKLGSDVSAIIIDFHAESTDEKEALALYLDGKVSAVIGTHTHVQTADERIFSKGTAYITDAGMIGPCDSVIGFRKEIATRRSQTQLPLKMEVAENPAVIMGVCVSIDADTGKAVSIERFQEASGL